MISLTALTALTSLDVLTLAGLLAAPTVAGLIYLDATRRGLSSSRGLLSGTLVGLASFVGFFAPHLFRDRLARLYLHRLKPRPIVVTPYEFVAVELAVGAAISAVCVLLYLLSSRHARF